LFRSSETFPFNFVFFLESFSSKPHKTTSIPGAKFGQHNVIGLCAKNSIEVFTNKQTDLTAARVLGQLNFRVKWTPISLQVTSESTLIKNIKLRHRHGCSHVQPFSLGRDADQTQESGGNQAYNFFRVHVPIYCYHEVKNT